MTREVRVVPYDSNWSAQYQQEVIRINGILKKEEKVAM